MSAGHNESRPLQDPPHCHAARATRVLFGLVLVLGFSALGGHGLAELADDLSNQAALGAAEIAEPALRDDLDSPLGDYLHEWGGPIMQLGFSFVAGFSIGYALASFLKIVALFAGGLLLILFGLQYVDLIDVNWLGIEGYYNALMAWMQPHAGSFREFIVENIPTAGVAALGLLVGLRKK